MKIAIEAQRIFRKEKHGMDYVALETIREIQKIDRQNEYFILVSPGEDRCLQESDNMHIVQIDYPSYPLWEQIGLPSTLKKIQPDLLHCTGNTAPLWCHTPLILTLHDIIFLEPKQGKNQSVYQKLGRCYRRFVVPRILNKCRKIITVSNFEREHICKFLHWEPKKITTVYNGYSSHFRHYLNTSSQPLPLLIADLKEEVINNYLRTYGLTDIKSMLYYPGYIPNKDLPALYSGATAFIYTSLRESFGIPILEAMACGTPVITSQTSAMPEIAGKDAISVNPYNPEEIVQAMVRLEEDPEYHHSLSQYGLRRVQQFSWKKTALKTLELYNEIIQQ